MRKEKYYKTCKSLFTSFVVLFLMCGCTDEAITILENQTTEDELALSVITQETSEKETEEMSEVTSEEIPEATSEAIETSITGYVIQNGVLTFDNMDYTIIEVDGGDRNGTRQNNVAVNIGFADRNYWGLTNGHGQLVCVLADEIILQDDDKEPVNKDGRYYDDEANVPGTERSDLDQGHIIADSLGGVANAYNITPQDSVLNRHGNQAYMEKVIRDAGGCRNFVATVTYADENTQIPASYRYEYILMENAIVDEFNNVNPESEMTVESENDELPLATNTTSVDEGDVSTVDTNGNGQVTIKEAKAAGYAMPITSDHWLYPYMRDADGDGMVGE